MPDLTPERDPIDLLAEEFAARCRRGEEPSVSEYAQKYPELAGQIHDLLPPVAMMEALKREKKEARSAASPIPEQLGDFHILRELGRGGMGIVYEARQKSLERRVALKVLPKHSLLDPKKLQRFQREAQAAARLHHTNIVPVFGVGEEEGLHFIVMQFIDGRGLNEVVADLKRQRAGLPSSSLSSTPAPAQAAGIFLPTRLLAVFRTKRPRNRSRIFLPAGRRRPATGNAWPRLASRWRNRSIMLTSTARCIGTSNRPTFFWTRKGRFG